MSKTSEYIAFGHGLDEASALTQPRPGRLLSGENVEVAFGEPGIATAWGYERFDGRPLASLARPYRLSHDGADPGAIVGQLATTPGGSAVVLRVDVPAGLVVVTALTGAITLGEEWSVGGVPKGTVTSFYPGDALDDGGSGDLALARTHYRSQIQAVPGEGPVRGVAIYRGEVYALRDAAGGATAALWCSSAAGWVSVRAGLRPGGTLRGEMGNFTGATTTAALFGVDGKNRYWKWDGAAFTFGPAVWGTDAGSASNVTPGLGAKSFTIAEAGKSWAIGQAVRIYSATDAGRYMVGTVTSWAHPNLGVNVTAFAGAAASDWHVCAEDGSDRPFALAVHRNHLFLAYPRGQLQSSNLGDPMAFTGTSLLLGVADEIRGLRTLRGEVLAVPQASRISLLYGAAKDDWDLRTHSQASGILPGSLQEVGGNGLFATGSGIMSLSGSQNFGDFEGADLSREAKRSAALILSDYRAASLIKSAQQYRVYGQGMQVLVMTSLAPGVFTPEATKFTTLRYLHQPVCVAHETVNGQDFVVFGCEDGYVMRERSGTTFDGAPVASFFRTSYWDHKLASRRKRWFKATLDAISTEPGAVFMRQEFDLSGDVFQAGEQHKGAPALLRQGPSMPGEVHPSGGLYDEVEWNSFYWSEADASRIELYIDGVGLNQSLAFWCENSSEPMRFVGIELRYSLIGVAA